MEHFRAPSSDRLAPQVGTNDLIKGFTLRVRHGASLRLRRTSWEAPELFREIPFRGT
jgi:hypothetical protein